jgi:lipopolysaccharide transport system ATP-binding protein
LCTRGIVMENGKVVFQGSIDDAIDEYLNESNNNAYRKWDISQAPKSGFIRLLEAKVLSENKEIALNHSISDEIKIEFLYEILKENEVFTHGFNLFNNHNIHILSSHDKDSSTIYSPLPIGIHSKTITIPGNFLAEGGYTCSFAIMRYNPFHVEFHEMEVVGFNVIDEIGENTVRGNYSGRFPGIVRPLLNWK